MYPKTVNKDGGDGGLYCQIMTGIPYVPSNILDIFSHPWHAFRGRVVAVLVGIALVLSFSLEGKWRYRCVDDWSITGFLVYLGVMLRKNWRAIGDQRSKLPLSMMLRVTIFMGGSGLAFRYETHSDWLGVILILPFPSTVFVFLSKMFEISNLVMAISK